MNKQSVKWIVIGVLCAVAVLFAGSVKAEYSHMTGMKVNPVLTISIMYEDKGTMNINYIADMNELAKMGASINDFKSETKQWNINNNCSIGSDSHTWLKDSGGTIRMQYNQMNGTVILIQYITINSCK